MKIKPTIMIGVGDIGCRIVAIYLNKIKNKYPESLEIVRALGIELESRKDIITHDFYLENLSGFIPAKIAERYYSPDKDDSLYWLYSNVSEDKINRLSETVRSDPMIRPIGRLSLFLKANNIQKVLENFIHEIRLIWKESEEPINFFIISPIFDGLGGGTVFDIAYITRAASVVEKANTTVTGIFIAKSFADDPKASFEDKLKKANLYAFLSELYYFQRTMSFKPLSTIELGVSLTDRLFNICYLLKVNENSKEVPEDTFSSLSSVVEILSIIPLDSARRMVVDQLDNREANFASFGFGILKYNFDIVILRCALRLSYELLEAILDGRIEKHVRDQTLLAKIEDYDAQSIYNDFIKKINENELSQLSKIKWRTIKSIINREDLVGLRSHIFNKKFERIHPLVDNYLLEAKNKLTVEIELDCKGILTGQTNGLIYSKKFLYELSSIIKKFIDTVSKMNEGLASNKSVTEESFNQLISKIKQISERSFLQRLKEAFNRRTYRKRKNLVDEFSSLLLTYARQSVDSCLWPSILNFYREVVDFLKVISEKPEQKALFLHQLLVSIQEDIEKEKNLYSPADSLSQPLLEEEALERMYQTYRPNHEKLIVDFYQNHQDFWTLNEDINNQLKNKIVSYCSACFGALRSMDISALFKTESFVILDGTLNRLYAISKPRTGQEIMDGDGFGERVIIRSGIDKDLFKDAKEKVHFDFEVIDDKDTTEILMVREQYGIKLSKLPEIKELEQAYFELKANDFPLHIIEESAELSLLSHSPEMLSKKTKLFLIGLAAELIFKRDETYFWVDSSGNETELAQGKESAFLIFLEKDEISNKVEQRINEAILTKGKSEMKKSIKNLLKAPNMAAEFTKSEMDLLGEIYGEIN